MSILTGHHSKSKFLAGKSRSLGLTAAALPVICALSLAGESSAAAILLFEDTFNRADNDNLNAVTTGKSGTLGALGWNERITKGIATDDVDIVSNSMGLQAGNGGSTGSSFGGVAYVDHNFIGYTTITVAFDYVFAPTDGGYRQLGFGIGNTKTTLDALTSSAAFGDIGISYDRATSITPFTTGVQILHNGVQQSYISRTIAVNDTLSATFSFANMNAGTAINYEVFHEGASIYTGSGAWSATNQNYIGLFNNHRSNDADVIRIDNFSVTTIPEPTSALFGGIGLLCLFRRRR